MHDAAAALARSVRSTRQRLPPHRLADPRHQRFAALHLTDHRWIEVDPLGGRLDDLLVEVAKAQPLGNTSCYSLTFGASQMRDADDSLRPRHNSTSLRLECSPLASSATSRSDDYLFASPTLAERLRRCVAFNPTEWYAFSDPSQLSPPLRLPKLYSPAGATQPRQPSGPPAEAPAEGRAP